MRLIVLISFAQYTKGKVSSVNSIHWDDRQVKSWKTAKSMYEINNTKLILDYPEYSERRMEDL